MEIWKPVVGWEGRYEVSSMGRIRRPAFGLSRYKTELIRKPQVCVANLGYLQICLRCKGRKLETHYVHDLVCTAFHGPRPPGFQCRHKDGNHLNNIESNLCWGTRVENEADRVLHGTSNRGERHGRSKLKECQVVNIRDALKRGRTQKEIALDHGISSGQVSAISRGKAWAHLSVAA